MEAWLKYFIGKDYTPAFIFDIDKLLHRTLIIKSILAAQEKRHCSLCYAMKANPFLIAPLGEVLDKFEVCSPGELSICINRKVDSKKIVFSGVNKRRKEIETALKYGVETFTVESKQQLDLLRHCAKNHGRTIAVLLRITSGNQFGMDWDMVRQVILHREKFPELNIRGIQYYSGTQKRLEKTAAEIDLLHGYVKQLKEAGYQPDVLEYGPGLGVDYFGTEEEGWVEKLLQLNSLLNQFSGDIHLVLEMGRFLAADCGRYLTKVVDWKRNEGKNYCLVDGGIHHVNYYGQVMGARKPPITHLREQNGSFQKAAPDIGAEKWNICGSLCTSADVLARNLEIAQPGQNDFFLFEQIGAYSVTEGIYLFLSRDLPKIFFWQDENLDLIRDSHETWEWNCENCVKQEGYN